MHVKEINSSDNLAIQSTKSNQKPYMIALIPFLDNPGWQIYLFFETELAFSEGLERRNMFSLSNELTCNLII